MVALSGYRAGPPVVAPLTPEFHPDSFSVAMLLKFIFASSLVVAGRDAIAQTPSFRVETRMVEVPVVVRDRKTGQNVTGLTAADFVILENGRPQRIEFCGVHTSASQVDPRAVSAQATDLPTGLFSNRRSSEGDGPPVVAVLIDGFNARYEEQYYAAQAAAGVISRAEQQSQWSLYFLGKYGIRILHDYSTDTTSLVQRLRTLRATGDSMAGLGASAAEPVLTNPTELAMRAAAAVGSAELNMRIRTTLDGLRDIGRHLSALPGRKSLIWMTAGLSLRVVIQTDPDRWHATLDTLNDANVAVYSIDSAGVRAPGGYLAEIPTGRTLPSGRMSRSPIEPIQILDAVSAETGGQSFKNTNDLARSFTRAMADSRTFYRLAYRTTNQKWDGRYMSISVKIPARRGIEIRHRLGYQARPLEPVAPPDRNRLLAEAILSPLEAVEIGLIARLTPSAGGEESALRLTVEPGSVTLGEGAGRYRGRFDVRFVQATVESKVLDDFTDEVNLNLKPPEATRTHGEGFNYDRKLRIRPGAHTLKIAFCDHATGRVGSLRMQLPAVAQ
jgi:VWFA-related protein